MDDRFGVDEAGKGPVLGSMFVAAVRAPPAALPGDVGDSKGIRPARREELAEEIRTVASVSVVEVPVDRVGDPGANVNDLTVAAHADALCGVVPEDGSDRGSVAGTVDAADADADRFGRRVADAVDAPVRIEARHRADESDPLVGAASVVAKVARDAHVDDLADEYGAVGSGYPSDPTTREFLKEFVAERGRLPDCARESWSTCDDLLAAAEQTGLGEF